MEIAVIGAGNIGATMGKKWAQTGHQVLFGVRDPSSPKVQKLIQAYPDARIQPSAAAIQAGAVILLATPYAAVEQLVRENSQHLAGKIVIDSTNNFAGPVTNNLACIQQAAPTAQLFRAFNSLGWEVFANPQLGDLRADHFFAGPDDASRPIVEQLIAEIGVRPIWVGDLDMASVVDSLGKLWVTLVFQRGFPRGIALKLIVR